MATIKKKICDRCKEEMVYNGWTAKLRGIKKTGRGIKILKLHNGNPTGYDYSQYGMELCAECTKRMEEFLDRKYVGDN